MSIDALDGPVDAIIRSLGNRSMMLRGSGVRSRITKTTSNGARRSTSSSAIEDVIGEDGDSARAVTGDQSADVSATFW